MMIYYLQISAFYFPTFAKADCTIFALLVGWLVGPVGGIVEDEVAVVRQSKQFSLLILEEWFM